MKNKMTKTNTQSIVVRSLSVFCFIALSIQMTVAMGKISLVDFPSNVSVTPSSLGTAVVSDAIIQADGSLKSKNDGRFVAFSTSNALAGTIDEQDGGPQPKYDVYIRDRASNSLYLASVNNTGTARLAQCSFERPSMAIVKQGTDQKLLRVVFYCSNSSAVFMKEYLISDSNPTLTHQRTITISCTNPLGLCVQGGIGTQTAFNGNNADISGNGRYVVYDSGDNPVHAADGTRRYVYRLDLNTGATDLISQRNTQTTPPNPTVTIYRSEQPTINFDGNFVTFKSTVTVQPSSGPSVTSPSQIYIADAASFTYDLVSKTTGGTQGDGDSGQCKSLGAEFSRFVTDSSNDGRWVAFLSKAPIFHGGSTTKCGVFLRDRALGTTIPIETNDATDFPFYDVNISDDGRFILYGRANAGTVLTAATIYDRPLAVKRKLYNRNLNNTLVGAADFMSMSRDGRFVSFQSSLPLVYQPLPNNPDNYDPSGANVFVHDIVRLTEKSTGDFNGDGETDPSVLNPSANTWNYKLSPDFNVLTTSSSFGLAGDLTAPGDYDGDGKTDIAIFRPSTGQWAILNSLTNSVSVISWGASGDKPVAADYDGDNKTDLAVFRPSTGLWAILNSSNLSNTLLTFGQSGDKAVPNDYDSDGKADVAVYRPSTGDWYLIKSHNSAFFAAQWGNSTDIPIPMDQDGDGKAELCVWRESNGTWYIKNVDSTGAYTSISWGTTGDKPVPGDYDNDGFADAAVFRPSGSAFWLLRSSDNNIYANTGSWNSTDVPLSYNNLVQ